MGVHRRKDGSPSNERALRVLVATLGSRSLAFEADSVDGLLTVEVGGRAGVVMVQGVVYRPVDLSGRLGLHAEEERPESRVVLLSLDGLHGCVRVAQVRGLREVEAAGLVPLPRQFRGDERNWYRGLIVCEETLTLVLNMSWVLCGIEGRHEEGPLEWYERGLRVISADPDRVTGRGSQC